MTTNLCNARIFSTSNKKLNLESVKDAIYELAKDNLDRQILLTTRQDENYLDQLVILIDGMVHFVIYTLDDPERIEHRKEQEFREFWDKKNQPLLTKIISESTQYIGIGGNQGVDHDLAETGEFLKKIAIYITNSLEGSYAVQCQYNDEIFYSNVQIRSAQKKTNQDIILLYAPGRPSSSSRSMTDASRYSEYRYFNPTDNNTFVRPGQSIAIYELGNADIDCQVPDNVSGYLEWVIDFENFVKPGQLIGVVKPNREPFIKTRRTIELPFNQLKEQDKTYLTTVEDWWLVMNSDEKGTLVTTLYKASEEVKNWFEEAYQKEIFSKDFYDLIHSMSDIGIDYITFTHKD